MLLTLVWWIGRLKFEETNHIGNLTILLIEKKGVSVACGITMHSLNSLASQMLVEEWEAITLQCVSRLVTSTRRGCQAVTLFYLILFFQRSEEIDWRHN